MTAPNHPNDLVAQLRGWADLLEQDAVENWSPAVDEIREAAAPQYCTLRTQP